ncbi:MAG: hypothetical protein H7263_13365 [Candidatus Sericytochromatia bacterium]|nr:hypothetical protein [Candidatus Sericytochromatia bacterium]
MKLFHDNSSIECLAAEIFSKRIAPSSYMMVNNIGRCFVYKCTRNSEAIITKELDPKTALHNQHSALNMNDFLEGENITVALDTRRSPKVSKVGGFTHRHGTQNCSTKCYTFAMITKQIPGNPFAIPPLKIEVLDPKSLEL